MLTIMLNHALPATCGGGATTTSASSSWVVSTLIRKGENTPHWVLGTGWRPISVNCCCCCCCRVWVVVGNHILRPLSESGGCLVFKARSPPHHSQWNCWVLVNTHHSSPHWNWVAKTPSMILLSASAILGWVVGKWQHNGAPMHHFFSILSVPLGCARHLFSIMLP